MASLACVSSITDCTSSCDINALLASHTCVTDCTSSCEINALLASHVLVLLQTVLLLVRLMHCQPHTC